jgi:hypothetical protein
VREVGYFMTIYIKIYYNYKVGSLYATKECIIGSWFKEDRVVLKRKVIRAKEGNKLVL